MATKIIKGYEIEQTAPRRYYVTTQTTKQLLGPFSTRKRAIEFATDFDNRMREQ